MAPRRWLVVCAVALLLTGTVTPAVGAPKQSAAGGSAAEPSVPATAPDRNGSALERKLAAAAILESLRVERRSERRHRDRALDRLRESIAVHRDGYRVGSRAAFRDDRRALVAMARLARTNRSAADEAADLVVAADRVTAETAIADARRAYRRFGGRLDDPDDRRRVERLLERAERARDRGRGALPDGEEGPPRSEDWEQAVDRFEKAWRRAQQALDVMDRGVEPTVTIVTRTDPPWNGSGVRTHGVRGNVSAVRPYDLGDLAVTVNDTLARSVTLDAPTAPARNASFVANVTRDAAVVSVAVFLPDRDRRTAGRDEDREEGPREGPPRGWKEEEERGDREKRGEHGTRGDADDRDEDRDRAGGRSRADDERDHPRDEGGDEYEDDGQDEEHAAAAVVRFDGDGLPDTFEDATTGTDPLDPDSDAARTRRDEGDDGLPDGGEDFDDDGLITFAEYDRGTDPFAADTDRDGLGDLFEASQPALDATAADTDGNGVPDGDEDFDGEGLPAADELANGTSIATRDTDRDGLDDAAEVRRHGTSPVVADTDRDGLGDGEELAVGAHPTDGDTDDDGVPDGDEAFTSSTTEPATGVSVSAIGPGNAASGVTVEPVAQPAALDVAAGPVVRIRNRTGFDHATVSVPIRGGSTAGSGNLSMFKWTPGINRPWRPIESTVDRANGTVTANVSSFSYFTVVDERRWRSLTGATVRPGWPHFEGFDALEGWSVDGNASVENGSLVVSGSRGADLVVAADGRGDFRRIQPAVDAASVGDTIAVQPGTYAEEVIVDVSVRLLGTDATLDGAGFDGESVGLRVVEDARVSVAGVAMAGYERGVVGTSSTGDVRLRDVTFRDTRYPVVARGSTGDWSLDGVVATGTDGFGVSASGAAGDWRITNTTLADGGLVADETTGDWTVSDTTIAGRFDGVDAWGSEGEWTVRRSVLSGGEDGFDANGAAADVTLVGVDASGNERGIVGFLSTGNWTIQGADLRGNEDYGVYAGFASGAWTIRATNASGNGVNGVSAGNTGGDWALLDVAASDNGDIGVNAYRSRGDWRLSNVEAARNAGWSGVFAYGSSGDWTVSDVDLSANGEDGLAPTATSGNWQVTSAVLAGNGADGLDAAGAVGELSITRSAVHDNGGHGVNGDGAARPVRAANVWWGRPGGPTVGQVSGAVAVQSACAEASCAPVDVAVDVGGDTEAGVGGAVTASAESTGPVDATRVRRDLALTGTPANVTITASVTGQVDPGASAVLRLRDGNDTVTVGRLTSPVNRSREVTAAIDRFTGETASLEVLAEEGATIVVDWIDVAYDTDGDGLRDLVEEADLSLPVGPVPGAPLDALDPTNPDSDGDGIHDGAELTDVAIGGRSTGVLEIHPAAGVANPTAANSDGGGLNDSEERAVGSDPFVRETLVAGYALPTMTEGPGRSVVDGNPMTAAEADGLQVGGGDGSDLLAWPSRQYFDPLFCIKELTAGPGCAPGWLRGVDVREDRHYVYVPFLVYLQSDVDLGEVPYRLTVASRFTATLVKEGGSAGTIGAGESKRGYVVYELPNRLAGEELQPGAFRSVGTVSLHVDLSGTAFERGDPAEVQRGYSVSTSTLLPRTEQMLEDTRFVLSHGLTVATAAETGFSVAVETGSSTRGALAFLYELAIGQIDTPPRSISDLGEKIAEKGIASFEEEIRETQGEIERDIFGDGVVRPVGPTIIRQN